jgi:4-amino-4-deoxy-L-arabinose transferase-like glycosyltransferase
VSTGQDSKGPQVTLATVAAWRRRQEACSEVVSPADDQGHANGYSLPDRGQATNLDGAATHANGYSLPDRGQATNLDGAATHANGYSLPDRGHATDSDGAATHANGYSLPDHGHATDSDGAATHANGFHTNGHVALGGRANSVDSEFARSQQDALNAMLRFARLVESSSEALPAVAADVARSMSIASAPASTPAAAPAAPADAAAEPALGGPTTATAPADRQAEPGVLQRRAHWARLFAGRWPLLCVLAVQTALSLRLVWSNTAFTDEGLYLWAGHLELAHWLNGVPVPIFPTYFSGAPVVYPPLGALADSVGGLAGARILSLCFMLGATCLLYCTATRLYGREAGLLATALFVTVGPTQDLGAFATYDAMAVFLLALAAWLTVRAVDNASESLLVAAGLTLALSDAAKYATVLWDPVVLAIAVLTATEGGWITPVARGVRLTAYTAAPLAIGAFALGGRDYLQGIVDTTLAPANDLTGTSYSVSTVLWTGVTYIGVLLILAIIGIAAEWRAGMRIRLQFIALTCAAVLAPIDEARLHLLTALYKHVVFGVWFAAIVAGYTLSRATAVNKAKGWRIAVVATIFLGFIGYRQATDMFSYWPSSTKLTVAVARELSVSNGPVLADNADSYVLDYYLYREGVTANIVSDKSLPTGTIVRQIHDHDFTLIEISVGSGNAQPSTAIIAALKHASNFYHMAVLIPWKDRLGHGFYEIFAPPGNR